MKAYISIFAFIILFNLGNHSTTAQEVSKKERAKVEYQERTSSDIANIQTKNLKELLNLDAIQVLSVYHVLFNVEQKMEEVTKTVGSEEAKMAEMEKWETIKTEKLKEILTSEQFSLYMNTIKNNKR